ncbi:hypothetical protein OAK82_02885 [Candidatus Thioglobus sp.]|nr:hypothetical protein [Candidatus Thioglobus sp.]
MEKFPIDAMSISEDKIEDKIIVLKAFDLGYVIREKDEVIEQTLKLLDNAIDQLSKKTKKADLINLLFYLIVKCELLRFNNNIKYCREKAQEIAQQINKQHMYKDYMAIVEVTTRNPRVKDINQQTSHNSRFDHREHVSSYLDVMDPFFGNTYKAIQVDPFDLSERQSVFLFRTNLLQIMKEHNIQI